MYYSFEAGFSKYVRLLLSARKIKKNKTRERESHASKSGCINTSSRSFDSDLCTMDDVHVYAIYSIEKYLHKMAKTFASNRIDGIQDSEEINPILVISNQKQQKNKKREKKSVAPFTYSVKDLWTKSISCIHIYVCSELKYILVDHFSCRLSGCSKKVIYGKGKELFETELVYMCYH